MAEYIRVRYPDDMIHRIPDEVSFEDAVLLDTICVSLRGVQQSRFRLGDNVVVIGAGAIGLAAIQLLKIGGARHITVLQPSPAKRELALQLGADLTLSPAEEGEGLQGKIMSLYGGIGADIVFECAGTPESFQSCFNFVKNRGQVLLLGVTEMPVPIAEGMLVIKEIDVRATLAYGADEVDLCLDMLAKRRFNTRGMLSDIISLDDIVEKGFERLISTKGLVKIAVAP
jgi:(R,R)-butanediol dehydrogenase/meso-butanediol dehydrogenase/diacetyl reductase